MPKCIYCLYDTISLMAAFLEVLKEYNTVATAIFLSILKIVQLLTLDSLWFVHYVWHLILVQQESHTR